MFEDLCRSDQVERGVRKRQPLNVLALNAAAGIYVAGLAPTLAGGVQKARDVIASGAARKKLDAFVGFTQAARDQ